MDRDAELAGERLERLTSQQAQGHLTLARKAPALLWSGWAQGER